MRRYSLLPLSLISAAALFASPVFAQEARIYCCDDANGRKVCGDFVPKECERRAYEERDNKGYVINKVEAPLTPEQQARRAAETERKLVEEKAKAEERRRNLALLSTYASEADIDAARDRSLREVDKLIKEAEQAVVNAEKNLAKTSAEKEFYKGKELPSDLKSKIRDLEAATAAKRVVLDTRKRDIGLVTAKFADERKKFRELKGITAPSPTPAKPAEAKPAVAAPAPVEAKKP
ncbi:MAG: hypothetical protein KA388_06300 [Rhodocyclaceae bacterium]|nr:hypothetical protein [Rhodocyclaceae bacterium]MBL0077164.1 hypothetical protein [Rhodocyclaceae bacterium]MBP6110232.1 hypothetical protein [Rhodocyclaceae bacterium]MBP6279359.1 hypothetical protein [Rhodocyclaceae bacterium]